MKTKKSQMEIMGLAVIFLLVIIAILIAVRFGIGTGSEERLKQEFEHADLASSTLDVLLKTTTQCKGSTVRDLYQDCGGLFQRIDCNDDGNPDSCEFVNSVVNQILTSTLDQWKKNYDFKAYIDPGSPISSFSRGDCGPYVDKHSKTYVINVQGRHMFITLEICG